MKRYGLILALLLAFLHIGASEPPTSEAIRYRVPSSTLLYGAGYTNQYDSYISPLEYRGAQVSLLYDHKHFFAAADSHVSFESLLDVQMHTSSPESSSLRMYGGDVHYDAGWYYNWWHVGTPRLSMKAGGQVGGTLGGIYCDRVGNNPANAHASIRLSASVGAQYALPLRRTQLAFRYQADLPLIGAAFSPDYEQSYYELYKYGYSHNICATSPFNAFSIRQLALIDIRLRHCKLTVGYKADIRQAKPNHLRQHQYAHSFMIGWSKDL